ncbi:MAG: DNA polymerase III subunit beta [Coxiellaceae bacterium]|nr:MAG: DNA polymerase III subunit beta [Coxiellaceae bacterium]
MNITIDRDTLLKPLQAVIGVVERRQTLPILANVLISTHGNTLSITGTDLEVELQARMPLAEPVEASEITVPGRKLADICRSLPENASLQLVYEKDRIQLRSGRSRFTLTTLPASDFPRVQEDETSVEFSLAQEQLRHLIERTHFAMAQQDVRYYLNGMLLELNSGSIRAVATDGHRLALNSIDSALEHNGFLQVILPRKGVLELMRLLQDDNSLVTVCVGNSYIRIIGTDFTFTSKLVDGRFPDYERVLPKNGNKTIVLERDLLKQALSRAAILSNEKFRGVRLQLKHGLMRVLANNPEQEEAEEEISLDYQQNDLEIGFNVSYLLDILNTIDSEKVRMIFSDPNSSVLVEEHEPKHQRNGVFVVMPMRL